MMTRPFTGFRMGCGGETTPLRGGEGGKTVHRSRVMAAILLVAGLGCATFAIVGVGRRRTWGRVVELDAHQCCSGRDNSCCYAGTEPWVHGAKIVDISPECEWPLTALLSCFEGDVGEGEREEEEEETD